MSSEIDFTVCDDQVLTPKKACQSINGMVGGPTIGFYTIGIFMPFISEIPALSGLVAGLGVSIWVFVGQNQFPAGPNWTRPMEMTVDSCSQQGKDYFYSNLNRSDFEIEFSSANIEDSTGLYGLYHMSYCEGFDYFQIEKLSKITCVKRP